MTCSKQTGPQRWFLRDSRGTTTAAAPSCDLHLLVSCTSEAAAQILHLVCIQDDAAAWERQVYTFAQHRQLPELAPHIPIGLMAPTLRRQAYEMVRSANPAAVAVRVAECIAALCMIFAQTQLATSCLQGTTSGVAIKLIAVVFRC